MTYDVQPASGQFFGATFAFPVRVYYEDTDAGGIVYYANYLRFAERARTEFIRALGCQQQQALEAEDKCGFTVRSCTVSPVKCVKPKEHQPSCIKKFIEAKPYWQLSRSKWRMWIWGVSVRFESLRIC